MTARCRFSGHWAHRFVNKAEQPAHLVMIESRTAMKPDAALCGLGHEDCHQVNFAKDGAVEYTQATMFETPTIRLIKAEFSAGATLPRHEHESDHLLVALTRLDVTADHEVVSREPGTVFWHAGGFASLKNTGEETARFLMLELK
jgi:quercetin dioxygenase-like cupin family protein